MMDRTDTLIDSTTSTDGFWASVNILLSKPHVVNKRIWGCKIISQATCSTWDMQGSTRDCPKMPDIQSKSLETMVTNLGLKMCDGASEANVFLIELLPKNFKEGHAFQLVHLNKEDNQCTFYNVTPVKENQNVCPDFTYSFIKNSNDITLQAHCNEQSKAYKWLRDAVLPQFVKWGEESLFKDKTQLSSLSLVSTEDYYKKYNELKEKYGKQMVKIWPECTDPAKFVYEDIAIATYILLLWSDERRQKNSEELQTFVDLGCGNGLLVYLLTMEGHKGIGLDVRKRNIWDMYPKEVKLEEKTVTPSDINLFPDINWLIGNHSDELTPWIPVVAARSSYNCNFFLLPCCAYNFDGTKYQRQNSSKSQYAEYLGYIKDLCNECGFNTDMDRLKIPSTKRICLVGQSRFYPESQHLEKCQSVQNLFNSTDRQKDSDAWIENFKPREATERVRNCTQIGKSVIDSIVKSITGYILHGIDPKMIWSPGKIVEISELIKLLSKEELKALKSECGGLQTLLRNNHHIFKVQSGRVQLRYPRSVDEVSTEVKLKKAKVSSVRIKQKPCWFHINHPQGCPLTDSSCSFVH